MLISFGQVLEIGKNRLKEAQLADGDRDAELLLLELMHENRNFLFLHKNDGMDESNMEFYFQMIDRRAEGEPLQYITGSQEFMGFPFEVSEAVLIPRQDTETVVEFALERAKELKHCSSVLDMCCGSGAIAVSVAKLMPKADVAACDCSPEALAVAERNAARNGVGNRVKFCLSDLFEVEKRGKRKLLKGRFDMIVCNPPYIPSHVIDTLQTEVKDHEPRLALDGGADGLDFYRRIVRDAWKVMKKNGILVLEIGHDQADALRELLSESGNYEDIQIHKDLAGLDRIAFCRRAAAVKEFKKTVAETDDV